MILMIFLVYVVDKFRSFCGVSLFKNFCKFFATICLMYICSVPLSWLIPVSASIARGFTQFLCL
jgi:hypothetical protein